jgi:hypothetical protein
VQIKRLSEQVAQLQKIIQQDDMKQMMMDFASTTQAELEAERGELQVFPKVFALLSRMSSVSQTKLSMAETELEELRSTLKVGFAYGRCCLIRTSPFLAYRRKTLNWRSSGVGVSVGVYGKNCHNNSFCASVPNKKMGFTFGFS